MYINLMLCKQKSFKRSLSIFRIFRDSFLSVKTRKISAAHFSFLILFLSVRFAVVQCLLFGHCSRTSAALKIETKNHTNVCLYKIST